MLDLHLFCAVWPFFRFAVKLTVTCGNISP